MDAITLENVSAFYGMSQVLFNVNLCIRVGGITAIVGANGAGKTTLLRTIAGFHAFQGTIRFGDKNIQGCRPEKLAREGLILVPEGRRIFPGLTVLENLEVPAAMWHASSAEFASKLEEVFSVFPRLRDKRRSMGWSLSGGEQQMLALARGFMARPKVLLIDELSLGLAPNVVPEVLRAVTNMAETGVTIVLVEQNAFLALQTSQRCLVIETGRIVLEGTSKDLMNSDEVRRAYLGGG